MVPQHDLGPTRGEQDACQPHRLSSPAGGRLLLEARCSRSCTTSRSRSGRAAGRDPAGTRKASWSAGSMPRRARSSAARKPLERLSGPPHRHPSFAELPRGVGAAGVDHQSKFVAHHSSKLVPHGQSGIDRPCGRDLRPAQDATPERSRIPAVPSRIETRPLIVTKVTPSSWCPSGAPSGARCTGGSRPGSWPR